ncbi:50S ribosomal protein L27 [Nilaparvata lugens]|uniref:50S ribosomal protein L27 n=1 Tax=Nilaparvata lugens TaxID=108931 RepID=UPI00193CDF6B|nr:50S ribosomal protein L27 [Nilaparvata lugens]
MFSARSCFNSLLRATEFLGVNRVLDVQTRNAAKKSASSTQYGGARKPKRRGIKRQEGCHVTRGTILVRQNRLNYHPGLHVGFGKDGTLFALEHGEVRISCEKADINWDHTWIQRHYNNRFNQNIYKKYFHIIPDPQHTRFKLIDLV